MRIFNSILYQNQNILYQNDSILYQNVLELEKFIQKYIVIILEIC